jgi:hypothetical protein
VEPPRISCPNPPSTTAQLLSTVKTFDGAGFLSSQITILHQLKSSDVRMENAHFHRNHQILMLHTGSKLKNVMASIGQSKVYSISR